MTICTLQELPEVFKSDDPMVNGKSMTTNPDKAYRLDRHISKVAKWKRTARTQELINYCKWRVGEIETCDKPSAAVYNVLMYYKHNRLDKISENFKILIECHKELVDKAMAIDIRKRQKGNNIMTKSKKQRKQTITQKFLSQAERKLRCWAGSKTDGTALPTQIECAAIKCFQLHGAKGYSNAYSKPLLTAMLKHKDLVDMLYVDTKAQTIRLKTEEQKLLNYQELYSSVTKQNTVEKAVKSTNASKNSQTIIQHGVESGRINHKELHITPPPASSNTVPDTLSMLIHLAKDAGATEITIKL